MDEAPEVRGLFDMTEVQALAVPQSRFAVRAGKPAVGDLMRVVAAPSWAGEEFGRSYREAQSIWPRAQPLVVGSLLEAYALLGMVEPAFEAL
jgi:hypothetical protein